MAPTLAQPWLAFGAGLLTVAAPCVLPLLPVVLGASATGRPGARPVFIAAGFAISFTLLALVFGSVQHLLGLEQQTVRDAAALMLVLFGLCMVWPQPFQRLSASASGLLNRVSGLGDRAGPGWAGGFWSACRSARCGRPAPAPCSPPS